jgi:hypothetical protein
MAETKTKNSGGSRSRPSGARAGSNGSGSQGRSPSDGAKSRAKKPAAKAKAPKATGKTKAKAKAPKQAQEQPADGGKETASKAPAAMIAGGVALAGLAAGGLALARNGQIKGHSLPGVGKKRRGMHMPKVSMPKLPTPDASKLKVDGKTTRKVLGTSAKAFGDMAVEIGKAGYRVGELTSEVRRVREQASKEG